MAGQLADRVVIVTGASRGVGAEIAKVFAREGAKVVVNYFKSEEKARAVVEEIQGAGGQAVVARGDVTKPEDMVAVAQVAKESFGGRIDVLVNNALARYQFNPASEQASIKTVNWEHFDEQFKGTVAGSVNSVKAVLPSMEEQSYGKVINIGTNLVYNPVVTYYDYTSSKAAMVGLTRNLAAELGPKGIRVNLVAGGLLEKTDASSLTTTEVFDFISQTTPLRKTTTVLDFAKATVFFAAEASDAVTGQSISVDGGLTMP
eukprot:CAMPEP_0181292290 /NCGR_PEP_ID=MMETSP1101-20121128/2426_1 /TAXON_ID=46948 /ORGANISM="Rhodomonas abbreviata, Strain Caron Lab Isolate" /LENGTH=259 /DNA_ID=CAMNT_0023396747 /DNA_START=174 /DNA_END=953 /DNA_ORIENTATION=+